MLRRSGSMAESAWRHVDVDDRQLLDALAEAAREAGEAILTVIRRGFDVETKPDASPVTEADRAAELAILAALARAAPGVPVIAEEEVAAGRIPAHGDTYSSSIRSMGPRSSFAAATITRSTSGSSRTASPCSARFSLRHA